MKPHVYLFADGSASKGDDIGGWAAFAVTLTKRKLLYGVTYPTTISRCELMPIIEGLRWINDNWVRGTRGWRIAVYSDSEYTIKTLCGLYKRRKNRELWAALDAAAHGMQVNYYWRERNTLPYTEIVDGVCGALRRTVIKLMTDCCVDPRKPEDVIPFGRLPDDIADPELEG